MCAKRHGNSAIHISLPLLRDLDAAEFLMSVMALVLFTLKLTQLFQGMSSATERSSITEKIVEALAASSPSVRHISKKWLLKFYMV